MVTRMYCDSRGEREHDVSGGLIGDNSQVELCHGPPTRIVNAELADVRKRAAQAA